MKLEEPIDKRLDDWNLSTPEERLQVKQENGHFVIEKVLVDPITLQQFKSKKLTILEKVNVVEEMKRLVGEEYKRWTKAIDRLFENEN